MFQPIAPYFRLSKIVACAKSKAKTSLFQMNSFATSNACSRGGSGGGGFAPEVGCGGRTEKAFHSDSPKPETSVSFILPRIPVGGSRVIFIPDCKTRTGKSVVGFEESQSRKCG